MKTTRLLLLVLPFALLALAACASKEQKLLDSRNAYGVTQDRVIKYVGLPACPVGAPACHDPAVKAAFQAQAVTNAGAAGGDAGKIAAADNAYQAILNANGINCGAGAADSCP